MTIEGEQFNYIDEIAPGGRFPRGMAWASSCALRSPGSQPHANPAGAAVFRFIRREANL